MSDNAGFCGNCGGTMQSETIRVTTGSQNNSLGMKFKLIAGVVLAIFLVVGGYLGWNYFSSQASIDQKLDLAVKYLSDNNYEKAILAYNQAIEIDSKEVKAYQGLAKVYTMQKKYDDAKDTYDKGIKAVTTEDQIVLRLGLGGMYIDQGQMDNAEKTFREIKNSNARCLEAYWGLAMVYKQKGDNNNAEAMLKQAIERNPNEYRTYNALALYQQQNSQSDEAFDNLVKSLSLEINQQEAYLILNNLFKNNWTELRTRASGLDNRQVADILDFYSYYSDKDYQKAVSISETKLNGQTNYDKTQILTAIAMQKNGNTVEAETLIKHLVHRDFNKWVLSDLAEYYFIAGNKELARATAIKALEVDSTNLDAVALLQRINANDEEGKIYSAEYLLYNWKPVVETTEILAESEIKTFIKIDMVNAKPKTEEPIDQAKEENTDPKLALLQAAVDYFKHSRPGCQDLDIRLEPPYGNPRDGDCGVGVKEMNGDNAKVIFGEWGTEGTLMLFKHTPSGGWEYVRDIPFSYDTEPQREPAKAVNIQDKERIARKMLYDYRPDIKQKVDAGKHREGAQYFTTYVDAEWHEEGHYFLFNVYDMVDFVDSNIGGNMSTWGRYLVYPDTGEIWDGISDKRVR